MDFKKMELSELASLVKVSLKEPGIGKSIDPSNERSNKQKSAICDLLFFQ